MRLEEERVVSLKILLWSESMQGLVRPGVVVEVLEALDKGL